MMHTHRLLILWALTAGLLPQCAAAAITSEYELDALLPRQEMLAVWKKKIHAHPENPEHYYAYARLAHALGQQEEAVWAYQQLLAIDPNPDRVRMDLSVIYMSMGRHDEARALLDAVQANNPPAMVQQNIAGLRAQLDRAGQRHHFDAALTVGIGSDSNANAAPNSGNILILDTTVPLGQGAAQSDLQAFASVNLGHRYDIGPISDGGVMRWHSSALAYSTEQQELDELNLGLFSLRTGPEFIYTPLDVHLFLTGSYNYLTLDSQAYLRDPSLELKIDFPIGAGVRGWTAVSAEYREFLNSETVSTYAERSGRAYQAQGGLQYLFSERSLWEATLTLRRENAKKEYYADDQQGATLGHTYHFADGFLSDMFTVARVGYKTAHYDIPDTFISSKTRNDIERSVQFMLGRKLPYELVLTGAYSFTDTHSSLTNYRYNDHRYTLSLTKHFSLDAR